MFGKLSQLTSLCALALSGGIALAQESPHDWSDRPMTISPVAYEEEVKKQVPSSNSTKKNWWKKPDIRMPNIFGLGKKTKPTSDPFLNQDGAQQQKALADHLATSKAKGTPNTTAQAATGEPWSNPKSQGPKVTAESYSDPRINQRTYPWPAPVDSAIRDAEAATPSPVARQEPRVPESPTPSPVAQQQPRNPEAAASASLNAATEKVQRSMGGIIQQTQQQWQDAQGQMTAAQNRVTESITSKVDESFTNPVANSVVKSTAQSLNNTVSSTMNNAASGVAQTAQQMTAAAKQRALGALPLPNAGGSLGQATTAALNATQSFNSVLPVNPGPTLSNVAQHVQHSANQAVTTTTQQIQSAAQQTVAPWQAAAQQTLGALESKMQAALPASNSPSAPPSGETSLYNSVVNAAGTFQNNLQDNAQKMVDQTIQKAVPDVTESVGQLPGYQVSSRYTVASNSTPTATAPTAGPAAFAANGPAANVPTTTLPPLSSSTPGPANSPWGTSATALSATPTPTSPTPTSATPTSAAPALGWVDPNVWGHAAVGAATPGVSAPQVAPPIPPRAESIATAGRGNATIPPTSTPATPPSTAKPETALKSETALPGGLGNLDEDSRVIAVVGNQSIVAGELTGVINQMLEPYVGKASEEQMAMQREKLMQQLLPKVVENKLLYLEFLKSIPPDKLPEIERSVQQEFHKSKLEGLLKEQEVASAAELDEKLRRFGSSLDKQQRSFMERMMAQHVISEEVNFEKDPTHDELLAYYYAHVDAYTFPAKVKFEKISVDIARLGSREEAWKSVATMGNEIIHGAAFDAVAKRGSHDPRASFGGQYDWLTKGSLAWEKVDEAIFTIPTGKLSQIIEDNGQFHIVRVIERQEAGKTPFADAQEEIRLALKKEHVSKEIEKFVTDLRQRTYVWTIYDNPTASIATQPTGTLLK